MTTNIFQGPTTTTGNNPKMQDPPCVEAYTYISYLLAILAGWVLGYPLVSPSVHQTELSQQLLAGWQFCTHSCSPDDES